MELFRQLDDRQTDKQMDGLTELFPKSLSQLKSIEWGPISEPKRLQHLLKFKDHEVHLTCRGPWIFLGSGSLVVHLKWTPKSIELGPRSEPKRLWHLLKFEEHEVHLTCRGPWIFFLGGGSWLLLGNLKWITKSKKMELISNFWIFGGGLAVVMRQLILCLAPRNFGILRVLMKSGPLQPLQPNRYRIYRSSILFCVVLGLKVQNCVFFVPI